MIHIGLLLEFWIGFGSSDSDSGSHSANGFGPHPSSGMVGGSDSHLGSDPASSLDEDLGSD